MQTAKKIIVALAVLTATLALAPEHAHAAEPTPPAETSPKQPDTADAEAKLRDAVGKPETILKRQGVSDGEAMVLDAVGKATKQLKRFRSIIDFTDASLRAAQKKEPAPISPESSIRPLLEEVRTLRSTVSGIQMPADGTMGPFPPLSESSDARRLALHDMVEQYASLQARLLVLKQEQSTLAEYAQNVDAAAAAADVIHKAILTALDEHLVIPGPLVEDLALKSLDADTLANELTGLSSAAARKAKDFGTAVGSRETKLENFRSNIALLLSSEEALLDAEGQKLVDRQVTLEKDLNAIAKEGERLSAEQEQLEGEAATVDPEARSIQIRRGEIEAAMQSLNRDIGALNQLGTEIASMVYRDCPVGAPFATCTHDALKQAYVNRYNARVSDFNQRKAGIDSRRTSIVGDQNALNGRIQQLNGRIAKFDNFKARASAFIARREKVGASAKAFVSDRLANVKLMRANEADQDSLAIDGAEDVTDTN